MKNGVWGRERGDRKHRISQLFSEEVDVRMVFKKSKTTLMDTDVLTCVKPDFLFSVETTGDALKIPF